jgi:glycosyltransferase involved in cell wall biosynthesis
MVDKLKASTNLGRVHVLVEERPPNRAAVRMHIRSTTAEEVLETIGIARERLEQLLRDGAKLSEIREVMTRFAAERSFKFNEETTLEEIRKILEAL